MCAKKNSGVFFQGDIYVSILYHFNVLFIWKPRPKPFFPSKTCRKHWVSIACQVWDENQPRWDGSLGMIYINIKNYRCYFNTNQNTTFCLFAHVAAYIKGKTKANFWRVMDLSSCSIQHTYCSLKNFRLVYFLLLTTSVTRVTNDHASSKLIRHHQPNNFDSRGPRNDIADFWWIVTWSLYPPSFFKYRIFC